MVEAVSHGFCQRGRIVGFRQEILPVVTVAGETPAFRFMGGTQGRGVVWVIPFPASRLFVGVGPLHPEFDGVKTFAGRNE